MLGVRSRRQEISDTLKETNSPFPGVLNTWISQRMEPQGVVFTVLTPGLDPVPFRVLLTLPGPRGGGGGDF